MTEQVLTEAVAGETVLDRGSRAAVVRALRGMHNGRLSMTMPDGERLLFGDGLNPRGARHGLEAELRVVHPRFFRRCALGSDLGLAESYLDGDWTTSDLAEVIAWFILNSDREPRRAHLADRLRHLLRRNTAGNSRRNIAAHYDLSNEFFARFLDPSMTYSSALFERPELSLEEAQTAKYERLCRLLELKPDDRVLEIGGGWGAFSRYASSRYGCHVTSITISQAQYDWAAARRDPARIDVRMADYRTLSGTFTKIVSIEMLEAVGHEYLDTFFGKCAGLLAPNGLVALQVITCPDVRYERVRRGVDFIQKHIFPGGLIPSIGAMVASITRSTDLLLRDLFDLGDSYARTLQAWDEQFLAQREAIRALGFDEPFLRKWHYYFAYCLAAFRMRHVSVVQMLLTRPNNHALGSKLA